MSNCSVKSSMYMIWHRKKQEHDKGIYLLSGETITINLSLD